MHQISPAVASVLVLASCASSNTSGASGGPGGAAAEGGGPGQSSSGGSGGASGNVPGYRNVALEMSEMTPDIGHLIEASVVDAANQLVARAVLASLPAAAYAFGLPRSTPDGDYHLDLFADLDGNGAYDPPPVDQAWRIDLPASGDASLGFVWNGTFTDIGTPLPVGGDFNFTATEMDVHAGELFELRVVKADSLEVVGRYLLPAIATPNVVVLIPGIIADGQGYDIDFYTDSNHNGRYDPPPVDHAWRVTGVGQAAGLSVTWQHVDAFTDVGF
jgi:hypothetical protein